MTHSIVIADDHDVVRQGLRAVLSAHTDLHVVAEAADGLAAVRAVEQHRPDVLLLDLSLPALSGIEVTREAARIAKSTRVLIVSMHDTPAHVLTALRSGAAGYLLKGACAAELPDAIRAVVSGARYLGEPFAAWPVDEWLASTGEPLDPYETLTTRERQILQLAAEGRTAPEIAEVLFISARTVETHRANVMRKLGLRTQTDLVLLAVRRGLLRLT
ncbi:MAG TPA: response regulator transcription factor [Thermoanaerobaculia bacterium]